MTKQITTEATWYTNAFDGWDVKAVGPKPTAAMLANVHNLGARPGKQALAIAMGLRDCGVTGSQIIMACGAPQLNKMRGLITDSLVKRLPASPDGKGHMVYKLELTAKGTQRIKTTAERDAAKADAGKADKAKPVKAKAPAKPAKVKAAAKAKAPKAKAKPVEAPSTEAAPAA